MKALEIISKELASVYGKKTANSTNINICCPFHGETNPSLGVYIVPNGKYPVGTFYCFGCGAKGRWNRLADKLGLEHIKESDVKETSVLDGFLQDSDRALLPKKRQLEGQPFIGSTWRGINGDLIRELGGVLAVHPRHPELVLKLPIWVRGTLISTISALLEKQEGRPSYIIEAATNLKDLGLFPYDYVLKRAKRGMAVCVVEGPRDALRLIQEGVLACAMLGAQSWSRKKSMLMRRIANKGASIVLVLDGDKAGTKARTKVYKSLKDVGIQSSALRLNNVKVRKSDQQKGIKAYDPYNMPRKYIRMLKEMQ